MYEKVFKWLQDTLHFPPNIDFFKPPKRHGSHRNNNNQNVLPPPCKHQDQHQAGMIHTGANKNNTTTHTRWPPSNHGPIHLPFLPGSQTQPYPGSYNTRSSTIPFCTTIRNATASITANWTSVREKYTLNGKWPGGRGRAWAPPGLEVGEDASGTVTGDMTNFLENNNLENNGTYPDYGYNYNYDYDQPDWLTSHLDELYEIMRSSQIDLNIALTVFLAVVFLFGVTGNILVLAVFSRGAVQQQASTVFIKALAVTDLIICLVVLPGVLLKEWYIPYRWDALCQGWELIRCSTIPLSTLILASVAVDRYVRICRVDRSIQISTTTAKKILLVSATISVCLGIPPMLRMGVYQAGEDPDASKIYLGLCMGNDLLVSKDTVDRYWQAMAAGFLLVLLVVMVMYGLVFRTVYKQSRKWGRCAMTKNVGQSRKSKSGGTRGKRWFNRGYCRNDVGNDDENDDVCKENNKSCGRSNSEEDIGCCSCGAYNCQSYSKNGGVHPSGPQLRDEDCVRMQGQNGIAKDCLERPDIHGNESKRSMRHITQTIETMQSEKKKSSLSLSFLCSSKRNADIVIENPSKISYHKHDELHDDGVTSLDDGHVSYVNTPTASSSKQQTEDNKQNPLTAIFSCTSQLTVSRSAYVSKKSYFHSKVEEDDDDEDGEEQRKTEHRNKILFMPHWLRRWKRLITMALFTTGAQRDEEKRSAVKLALRQKAKIHMMNQEASCGIEANVTKSRPHPDSDTLSQNKDSMTENTFVTKLSSSNPVSTMTSTTETNFTTGTKLKKWSQSLDFVIPSPDQAKTKNQGCPIKINVKSEEWKGQNNKHETVLQQEFIMNTVQDFNTQATVPSSSTLDVQTGTTINVETGEQALSHRHSVGPGPEENVINFQEQFATTELDDSTDKQGDTLLNSTTLDVSDSFPTFRIEQEYISINTSPAYKKENGCDKKQETTPSYDNCSITKPDSQGPFQAWLKSQEDEKMRKTSDSFDVSNGFKSGHHTVHNTSSYPLPFQTVHKSTSGIGKGGLGTNKVHPLNSAFYSHSVPNIRVTQSIKSYDMRENNSDTGYETQASNKRWVFNRQECDDASNKSDKNKVDQRHCTLTINHFENDTIIPTSKKDDERQTESGYVESKTSDTNPYLPKPKTFPLSLHPLKNADQMKMYAKSEYDQLQNANGYGKLNCPHHHLKKKERNGNNGRSAILGATKNKKMEGGTGVGGGTRRVPQHRYNGAQVKTAQVLFLVTVVYVLSFAPVLLMSVGAVPSHPIPFYGYFIHSAANPILYSFINEAFRSQLYNLLCPRCCGKK